MILTIPRQLVKGRDTLELEAGFPPGSSQAPPWVGGCVYNTIDNRFCVFSVDILDIIRGHEYCSDVVIVSSTL